MVWGDSLWILFTVRYFGFLFVHRWLDLVLEETPCGSIYRDSICKIKDFV